jgi:hypothetical protein
MKTIARVATGLLMMALLALFLQVATGLPFALSFIGLLMLSATVPMPKGVAMGITLEVWANYIIERFYKDNAFLRFVYDDSPLVIQGKIVYIPQAGAKPGTTKNRSSFPATAVRRTDTALSYTLDEFTTDPTHIPNIDQIHLSYDKQDSVLGDHMVVLDELVAESMLVAWAANATAFATTGGPNGQEVAAIDGQTGNRKGLHHKDLAKLMVRMNVDNVPKEDRHILIDDNMYEFFYDSLSDNQQRSFSDYMDAKTGVVGKLHGFNIHTRSSVLLADADDAAKAVGASVAATDNLASFAWHKNSIAAAIGDHKLFQDLNNPLYYGDIHSLLVMAGGRVRRTDGKGVYMVVQGDPA